MLLLESWRAAFYPPVARTFWSALIDKACLADIEKMTWMVYPDGPVQGITAVR
jgi:hypothetical protein